MAMADVPFKTPEEIKQTISYLEAKFNNRYTDEDKWYRYTVEVGQRWRNVPVMRPWPPKMPRNRHRDGGRHCGYHERYDYYDRYDNRNRRDYTNFRRERRSRSPPSSYYDRTSPTSSSHQSHHSYDRLQSDHSHLSTSTYSSLPSQESQASHQSSATSHSPKLKNQDMSPAMDDNKTPPNLLDSPGVLEAPPTPTGCVSNDESIIESLEHELPEKKGTQFDINTLGSFGDDEPQAPPTESDVTDILNMAHGGHTKTTLKQTSSAPSGKSRHGEKRMRDNPTSQHSIKPAGNLQVTHGHSKDISPTELFRLTPITTTSHAGSKRKHSSIDDTSDDSDSEVDVLGIQDSASKPLTVSYNIGYSTGGVGSTKPAMLSSMSSRKSALSVLTESVNGMTESSVVSEPTKIDTADDNHQTVKPQDTDNMESAVTTLSTLADRSVEAVGSEDKLKAKKRKKKKNKKIKVNDKLFTTTLDDGSLLKIKLF